MSLERPRTHIGAFTQSNNLMLGWLNRRSTKERQIIAKQVGIISETIWKEDQVGIYQLRRKHVLYYCNEELANFSDSKRIPYEQSLRLLIISLKKEQWLPIKYGKGFSIYSNKQLSELAALNKQLELEEAILNEY